MFPEQLQKILKLIKQTGDRVVVYNPSTPDDSYVILDFDRYSSMVNNEAKVEVRKVEDKPKADEEIENKIRVETRAEALKELQRDLIEDSIKSEKLTEDDLTDKINREISMWKNRDNSAFLNEENKPKKAWQIPSQVKNNAQNIE